MTLPPRTKATQTALTVIGLISVATLSGCASTQSDSLPKGLMRTPINKASDIEAYQATVLHPDTANQDKSVLLQKVEDQQRQIQELKAYLVMLNQELEGIKAQNHDEILQSPAKGLKTVADKHRLGQKHPSIAPIDTERRLTGQVSVAQPKPTASVSETKAINEPVVLHVAHEPDSSQFSMADVDLEAVKLAAQQSRQIIIHGYAQGAHGSEAAKHLAIDRAVRLSQYLMAQGIDPKLIRLKYRTSGHIGTHQSEAGVQGVTEQSEIELTNTVTSHLS